MFPVKRDYRPGGAVLCQKEWKSKEKRENYLLEYLTFPNLTDTGIVRHLFTTRTGGVSEGIFSSLNLSFTRGDNPVHVLENYRRVTCALGCTPEDIVCSDQTHTSNIRLVKNSDRGKGVTCPKDFTDIDGLVTNVPGIALATFYADCVPLYFVDPVHHAIGLAHSGWKGTVLGMGGKMVERMQKEFGTRPEDLQAAIGPSICRECYEISEDVAQYFKTMSDESEEFLQEIKDKTCYIQEDLRILYPGKKEGKYQLDLWLANLIILHKAGIPLCNITVTDICTCHNPDYLFSHRASLGKRGNLGAFLLLKE